VDQLITIGDAAELIARGARSAGLDKVSSVRSTGEAADLLGEIAEPGDLVLIKGSRAARTEEVIEQFGSRHSTIVNSP
jgi:UDP-N-acetylmuramoyl-tripeptide--D-alanyl-D-alanine ligase